MATITERTNSKGISHWQVMIRTKNEKPIITTKPTLEEARDFVARTEKQLANAIAAQMDPFSSLPASGNWADEKLLTTFALFAKSKRCIKGHRPTMASLKTKVGAVTIGELGEDWIQHYLEKTRRMNSKRGRPFAVTSILKQLALVGVVLKWRAKQLKVPKPEFYVDKKLLPKGWDEGRDRRLERGEGYLIGMSIRNSKRMAMPRRRQYILLVRLALETAARLQELVLADWSEISFQRKNWSIPSIHTKCGVARKVPISPRARRILLRLQGMQIPGNSKIFCHLPCPGDVSDYFHAATQRSGVGDLVFHDLRHEAISRFVNHRDAYPIPRLMKITGHADYKTFERYLTFRDNEQGEFMS